MDTKQYIEQHNSLICKFDVCVTVHHVSIDKIYQLDATILIYYQQFSLHVSGIYMPIFRSTGFFQVVFRCMWCSAL